MAETFYPQWNKDRQDVPFDKTGNQLHYPNWGINYWSENEIFKDTLTYESFSRGRSAAYFEFRRKSNGKTVVVFMADLEPILFAMVRGSVTGEFTFCKRGQNYGCKVHHLSSKSNA